LSSAKLVSTLHCRHHRLSVKILHAEPDPQANTQTAKNFQPQMNTDEHGCSSRREAQIKKSLQAATTGTAGILPASWITVPYSPGCASTARGHATPALGADINSEV